MLINNNTQAASTIQHVKRTDMDPANAAASALYSGALQQAAQQNVTTPATSKSLDKAADRIDEAFAKTRVQLQASTQATTPATTPAATEATSAATDTPKTQTSTARADFSDYMKKSPAERIREQLLKEMGLTEEDVQQMPQERQDAIGKEVAQRVKEQQEQQVAAKTTEPQARTVKDILAAI